MRTDQEVIVVGAGLAGLVSAYELRRAGHKVLVLEAQDHPGGRVKTLRTQFSRGLLAEAGARFIPDRHKLTLGYVKRFRLTVVPLPDKGMRYYFLGMDQHTVIKKMDQPWSRVIPLSLTDEERTSGLTGIIKQYVEPALADLGDPMAPDWPPEGLKKYDDVSFLQFLMNQRTPPSRGAIDLIRPFLWWGSREDLDTVSALWMLRQFIVGFPTDKHLYTIPGGMDALPKAFANHLAGTICYRSPVVKIKRVANSVKVTYRQSGKQHTLTADRVICALPFSLLREMKVEPRFTTEKRQVIEQLSYASVARVFLQCRKRAWPPDLATYTDLPIQNLLDATLLQSGERKILESYMSGDQARTIARLKKSDRVPFVLGQAQLVYPEIARSYEQGDDICWDEDPCARGAYPFFRPKEMFRFTQDLVARPEGRVHFAGDHTSSRPGWMEGALESARRAANEVSKALKAR